MKQIPIDVSADLPDQELISPSEDPAEGDDSPNGDDLEDSDVEEDDDERAGVL